MGQGVLVITKVIKTEIKIERDIIKKLERAKEYLGDKAQYAATLLAEALEEIEKLYGLEYREQAPQQWKQWEEAEIKTAVTHVRQVRGAASRRFALEEQFALEKQLDEAIAIFEKMKKYELRIGG
jgi:hypothetical protein